MSVTYNEDGYPIYSGGENYGELIDVETLNVTENGTYTAERGVAYSPVNVNVEGGGGSSQTKITIFDDSFVSIEQYGEYGTDLSMDNIIPWFYDSNQYYRNEGPLLEIIFDEETYNLYPAIVNNAGEKYYGGWDPVEQISDFSNYPFCLFIGSIRGDNYFWISTKTSGEHTLTVSYIFNMGITNIEIINASSNGVMVNGAFPMKYYYHLETDEDITFSLPCSNIQFLEFMSDSTGITINCEGTAFIETDIETGRVWYSAGNILIEIDDYVDEG